MAHRPIVHVLGTAQDGGFPHAGCGCPYCDAARGDPARRRRVACIGVVSAAGELLIVDATPDFAEQMAVLGTLGGRASPSVDRIVLTHAHVGHYLGLALLGREVLSADAVPVHATKRMATFLRENKPWSHLVTRGEIELTTFEPGRPVEMADVTLHAFLTPHRAEDTDTIGLEIQGPERRLVYVPDTDVLTDDLIARVGEADIALIDGTFYSRDELRHRDQLEVRHPCVVEAIPRLQAVDTPVRFIHLNHTNALLSPSGAPDLPDGFGVAQEGDSHVI